jgi:hypothetical protein
MRGFEKTLVEWASLPAYEGIGLIFTQSYFSRKGSAET